LGAGARAWAKHAHRSSALDGDLGRSEKQDEEEEEKKSRGWWGTPSGPVASINERALMLFWKVMRGATWRNLHWLPHEILVYEVRVAEGYGMRWSQDRSSSSSSTTTMSGGSDGSGGSELEESVLDDDARPWIFRGFVEPMMENGHEVGWRH